MPATALDTLIHNTPHRAAPALRLGPGAALRFARLHEACGNARRTLALMIAARLATGPDRPVLWIAPGWTRDRLHGDGMARFLPPGHVILVHPERAEDVLWVMEETLRAGRLPLAVADLPGLPSLTAVRRMHLAAETGASEGRQAPLGLILTEGDGGAPGVESRWRLETRHTPAPSRAGGEGEGWQLDLLRARTDPPRRWQVAWKRSAGGMTLSPAAASG
ncbi:MAG: ImuA family protein [Pseudooceanicola sp.]